MMTRVRALASASVRRSLAPSLRAYRREWSGRDLLAAVALLALLGSDRHLSVGADSTIAPLVAAGVGTYAVAGSARYTHLAAVLALLVGAAVALVGLLRMGWIAELLRRRSSPASWPGSPSSSRRRWSACSTCAGTACVLGRVAHGAQHVGWSGVSWVEQGIGVAVALAILDRTRRTARPQVHVLGRLSGTTSWVPLSDRRRPEQVPGVVVALSAAPLWYANADHFRRELEAAVDAARPTPDLVVPDTVGMNDLDHTGARALDRVLDHLDAGGIGFAVARAGDHVRTALQRSGLLERIGPEWLFPSVDAAVWAPRTPRTKMGQDRASERETG